MENITLERDSQNADDNDLLCCPVQMRMAAEKVHEPPLERARFEFLLFFFFWKA